MMLGRINEEEILLGMEAGVVSLLTNPELGTGTVCRIGDMWFCFGGVRAEEMDADEYIATVPPDEIAREIVETLANRDSELTDAEWKYYRTFLDGTLYD